MQSRKKLVLEIYIKITREIKNISSIGINKTYLCLAQGQKCEIQNIGLAESFCY